MNHFQSLEEADVKMSYGDLVFIKCRPYTKARIIGIDRNTGETQFEDLLFLLDTGGQYCRIDCRLPFLQNWKAEPDLDTETGLGGTTTQLSLVTHSYGLMFGKNKHGDPIFQCEPKFTWSKRNIIGSKVFYKEGAILYVDYNSEIIKLL